MIPLLGLAGETGTLLSEFKKKVRDKESYDGFKARAEEEIGLLRESFVISRRI